MWNSLNNKNFHKIVVLYCLHNKSKSGKTNRHRSRKVLFHALLLHLHIKAFFHPPKNRQNYYRDHYLLSPHHNVSSLFDLSHNRLVYRLRISVVPEVLGNISHLYRLKKIVLQTTPPNPVLFLGAMRQDKNLYHPTESSSLHITDLLRCMH